MIVRLATVLLCCAASIAAAQEATTTSNVADKLPSTDDPWIALPVRDATNEPLAAEGISFARRLDEYSRQVAARLATYDEHQLSPQELSAALIATTRLRRIAELLELRKETAGRDLRLHVSRVHPVLTNARDAYRRLASFPADQLRQRLKTMYQQVLPEKAQIERLMRASEYEQAYERLVRVVDRLMFVALWLDRADNEQYLKPFADLLLQVQDELNRRRLAETEAALRERVGLLGDGSSDLVERLMVAEKALSIATSARWKDRTSSGPEIVADVANEWQQLEIRYAQLAACDVLLGESSARETAYKRVCEQIVERLAALIEADATDCAPASVSELHQAYLESLAPLVVRHRGQDLTPLLNPALLKLAGRDPKLAQQVIVYQIATNDMLRWRARWSTKQAEVRDAEFGVTSHFLESLLGDAKEPSGFDDVEGNHLVVKHHPVAITMHLRAEKVRSLSMRTECIATEKDSAKLRYAGCYGDMPEVPKSAYDAENKRLRADLLVDDSHPPLTLEAAAALWSAEHACWESVGARIKQVAVVPTDVLLLSQPDVFSNAPLDELPKSSDGQLSIRLSFDSPAWIGHRHFFVLLSPDSP